jgi:hypothetical protein
LRCAMLINLVDNFLSSSEFLAACFRRRHRATLHNIYVILQTKC